MVITGHKMIVHIGSGWFLSSAMGLYMEESDDVTNEREDSGGVSRETHDGSDGRMRE